MSRASVEQALAGLIPALNGPLPFELVDVALSLLARSRSVAHSLKPDEEIARPYACAQLACERLKTRLNLPSIASRPPCPPRIYKKLYNYLASALPDSTGPQEPQTPRKHAANALASAANTPRTPTSARKTPRTAQRVDGRTGEPPDWVMSSIRTLAKAFSYPLAAPHVYTGVESVLPLMARMSTAAAETPSRRSRRGVDIAQASMTDVSDTKVLALVAVVFLYILARMIDQDVTPAQYIERRELAVHSLLKLPVADGVTYAELSPETEALMSVAQEEGWLQMEWFLNVTPPRDMDEMELDSVHSGGASRSDAGRNPGSRNASSDYIGLGTMLQDATDYLGERQRADYNIWRSEIMARVEKLEAAA